MTDEAWPSSRTKLDESYLLVPLAVSSWCHCVLGSGSCHRCTAQVSSLLASHGLLGTESSSNEGAVSSSFISMCNVFFQADVKMTMAEAEEHSLPSRAW